jgi:hypothetical protein
MKIIILQAIFCYTIALTNYIPTSTSAEIKLSAECSTNDGYIAAISEKYLDDVIRYSIDKDYAAVEKLLKAGVIVQMKKGVKVYLVDTHLLSGKVEFRIPGQTDVLWTVSEGIKCN